MAYSRAITTPYSFAKLLRPHHKLTSATSFSVRSIRTSAPPPATDSDTDSYSDAGYNSSDCPLRQDCPFINRFLKKGPMAPFYLTVDDKAMYARLNMPGIGKEGLKLWVEDNALQVRGVEAVGDKSNLEDVSASIFAEEPPREYAGEIQIPEGSYKLENTKAELKEGVLKVKIPKKKLEEIQGVTVVKIN